jgi:hypothetical protein
MRFVVLQQSRRRTDVCIRHRLRRANARILVQKTSGTICKSDFSKCICPSGMNICLCKAVFREISVTFQ